LNKKEIAFSADYRAVPIYIDSEGRQINDSTPIMRRIDEEFPQKKVFKTDPAEAATEDKWLAWSEGFVKGLPVVIYETYPQALESFDYITKIGKFSWLERGMIKYSGALAMTLVAKKIKKREQIDRPDLFLKQKTKEWTDGLAGRPFMGGAAPGGADLAVFGIVQSVADLRAGQGLKENEAFSAWMNRVQESLN
ncbi:MAG TPA: hypothetical protein VD913_05890, partial [bacterium]|nr:hypothetical protein [bacterium]